MADDPNPVLRAQIQAAIDVLTPQIRGLQDFSKLVASSPDVVAAVVAQINIRTERTTLLMNVLAALDGVDAALAALEADGYPNLPEVVVSPSILNALQSESSAIAFALQLFLSPKQPVALGLDVKHVSLKPQHTP